MHIHVYSLPPLKGSLVLCLSSLICPPDTPMYTFHFYSISLSLLIGVVLLIVLVVVVLLLLL